MEQQWRGVIGARINGIGMQGIASDAELYSVKVLNEQNETSIGTVVKAIEWCVENGMDVINMSFGTNQYSKILENEVKKAYDEGIIMVAAAGNRTEKVQYPAAFPEVLSVGSVNEQLEPSDFSINEKVDVVAPGEDAQTIGYVGSYGTVDGTSIAAAHVSGVIAALKSARYSLTNTKAIHIIKSSAVELGDKSRLVNYSSAIHMMDAPKKTYSQNYVEEEMEKVLEEQPSETVKGSWDSDKWLDGFSNNGHYGIINSMDLSYFSINAKNDTEKIHNRWIVGDAAFDTDEIEQLSASGEGNKYRDENGQIVKTSSARMASPYHAKTDYDIEQVTDHLEFLYELARRRLILNEGFQMNATQYNGNYYHDVYIPQKMKRRIIVDIKRIYDRRIQHYKGTGVNLNTTTGKGYMILGVFLHLVQDIQAHRAKVTKNMLYKGNDVSTYYTYDVMTSYASDSRINGRNVDGSKNQTDLFDRIRLNGSIPIVRLKDFLKSEIKISCNDKAYTCSPGMAYEDNPYFYTDRIKTARRFSRQYIERMRADTQSTSTKITEYYVDSSVPLYTSNYKK